MAVYEHFLLLHSAITVLACPHHHLKALGLQLASELLNTFVMHSEELYGSEFLIYNVHKLTHIADDVRSYGTLDNISCFPFENYLGHLKHMVKSPLKPLRQVCRRLKEHAHF